MPMRPKGPRVPQAHPGDHLKRKIGSKAYDALVDIAGSGLPSPVTMVMFLLACVAAVPPVMRMLSLFVCVVSLSGLKISTLAESPA